MSKAKPEKGRESAKLPSTQSENRDRIHSVLLRHVSPDGIVSAIHSDNPVTVQKMVEDISRVLTGYPFISVAGSFDTNIRQRIDDFLLGKEDFLVLLLAGKEENKLMLERKEGGSGRIWVYVGPNAPREMIKEWSELAKARLVIVPPAQR